MEVRPYSAFGPQDALQPRYAMEVYYDPDRHWGRIKNSTHTKKNVKTVVGVSKEEWEAVMQGTGDDLPPVLLLDDPYNTPLDPSGRYQRVVCLSDTHSVHSYLPALPEAHILVHAGDFTNVGKKPDCDEFKAYIASIQHIPEKIVIAGNHDVAYDAESYLGPGGTGPGPLHRDFHRNCDVLDPRALKDELREVCTYLEDEVVTTAAALRIAGRYENAQSVLHAPPPQSSF